MVPTPNYRRALSVGALLLFACSCGDVRPQPPVAKDGMLDLSGWDFERDGSVNLKGEWRFAWDVFVEPGPISELRQKFLETTEVPGSWLGQADPNVAGQTLAGVGHGSYLLQVKLPQRSASSRAMKLGIRKLECTSAGTMSVWTEGGDERLLELEQGLPSPDGEIEIPVYDYRDGYFDVPAAGSIYILTHVSNHRHARGGIYGSVDLGTAASIDRAELELNIVSGATFGILVIIALYHFILFFIRQEDTPSLTFALFCAAMAMREGSMAYWFESLGVGWSGQGYEWLRTIEYSCLPFGVLCCSLFIEAMVPNRLHRRFVLVWPIGFGLVLCGFTVLTDTLTFSRYIGVYYLHIAVAMTVVIGFLIRESVTGNKLARWVLLAISIVALGITNDILHNQNTIQTGFITPYTFMFFVLMQSGIIARNFSRAFEERDASNQALLESYRQLDQELLKREKLLEVNSQLEQEIGAASEQLIQADKLATMGTMVAGVAHDIANPASLIAMSQERVFTSSQKAKSLILELLGEPDDDETQAIVDRFGGYFGDTDVGLDDIKLGAMRIRDINEAIRNQARNDQTIDVVEIKPLIEECLIVVGSKMSGIEVKVDCPHGLRAEIKRSQIGQVLMNLLANAADAVQERYEHDPEAPKAILVHAVENGDMRLHLAVEDSGSGVPADLREKILNPFFTTKEVGKGTGLGMAIVIRILEAHDVGLFVEDSESLGGAKMLMRSRVG